MSMRNDFRRGRYVVYRIHAHLVLVPKYRRRVLSARVFQHLEESFRTVCEAFEATLTESNYEPDHVHLLIEYPPKVALSGLVNSLKGASSRRLRALHLPELRGKSLGVHFWSPSYCAVSCGSAPLALIQNYVRSQRGASSPP